MSENRDATIDIAKGVAIISIVVGHVLGGLAKAGILDPTATNYQLAVRFLYMFHLSVLASLAGLFVQSTVQRDGVQQYLRSRDVRFVYLYLVWSLIQGSVKLLTATFSNVQTSATDMLTIWIPEGQLWFFPFLIVMTTAVALMKPWRSSLVVTLSLVSATTISLTAWGTLGTFAGTQGLGLSAYFVLGTVWGAKPFIIQLRRVRPGMAAAATLIAGSALVGLVLLTEATPPTAGGAGRTALTVSLGVVASFAGVVMVLGMARLLVTFGMCGRWLAFIGERSLEIFLAHIIAGSGTRIILSRMGVDGPVVHTVAGTMAGVLLPMFLWWTLNRVGFPWLFEASSTLMGRQQLRAAPVETAQL